MAGGFRIQKGFTIVRRLCLADDTIHDSSIAAGILSRLTRQPLADRLRAPLLMISAISFGFSALSELFYEDGLLFKADCDILFRS